MSEYKFGEGDARPEPSPGGMLRKTAVRCLAGAAVLFALRIAARSPVIAYATGGAVCAFGIGWLLSGGPSGRKAGIFIIAMGLLQGFSRFPVPHIALVAGTALGIGTMWLLLAGVRSLIACFIAQGKRYS